MTIKNPARMKLHGDVPAPPGAVKRPTSRIVHGQLLQDEYAWLRADNWQEVLRDPAALPADIRAHIEAENRYAEAVLAPARQLQKQLLAEMRGRMQEEDNDPPCPDGRFAYYDRYREGGQHELVCRTARLGGPETLLLDGDALAKGKAFFDMGETGHSPDHAMLAWSVDDKGSELYTIRLRHISAGGSVSDLADVLEETDGSIVWSADSTAFYYVWVDSNHRPARIFRHTIGTPQSRDVMVLEEADPGLFIHLRELQQSRFALVSVHDHDSSQGHLIDLHNASAPVLHLEPRRDGVRYDVEHRHESLYFRTNDNDAKDFRIASAPLHAAGRENWADLVPHQPGRMIVTGTVFENYMVRMEREDSLPRIVITEIASGAEHQIAFAEEAYSLGLDPGFEFDTPVLRFTYSSMTTPRETYDYNMATRQRILVKRQEVPSGHVPGDYVTRRLHVPSHDGASVPVSILYRRDRDAAAAAPVLLYGYGAYGYSIPASFSTSALSLVDRGFVYAIAHIRGGADKGWHWYEDGKLEHKPNTFADYVAVARYLVSEGYTAPGRIIAHGGSAGGMLMGAVANMAPELFGGIIADVPFVDVLNTMLDDKLPLTPPEWLEWGNPVASPEAFANIAAYSPYDNVRAQKYPAIFAQSGLCDPRVTYWEPTKWVARLRERMTGGGPVLLKTNMDAGHGGASGRFAALEETALDYAFAISRASGEWDT